MIVDKSIKIQNIYYMLAYAFNFLKSQELDKLENEEFENTADLLSAILAKGVSLLIKRGLGKEYIYVSEPLSCLRGKIEISQSIKERTILKRQLVCNYDDFSVNTYLNQIIKTTIERLLKTDIKTGCKKDLKNLLLYFRDITVLNPYNINWNIRFNRHNANYQILINICYLVIKGLLQKDEKGDMKMQNFLDEQKMCRLYEKFILEYYKKHFPKFKVSAPQIKWEVEAEEKSMLLLPKMQSDIMLEYNGKTLIIDAKYYSKSMATGQYNKQTFHSHNLYQIFAYVKNHDPQATGNTSGMLLYAKTDEEISPNADFMMSGNKISVKSLDLSGDFEAIKSQLDEIGNAL